MPVRFRIFRAGVFTPWEELFEQAAQFASRLGPGNVVSISHSADKSDGVVTVWYWSKGEEEDAAQAPADAVTAGESADLRDPEGWACDHCRETNPPNFEVCWKCQQARPGTRA